MSSPPLILPPGATLGGFEIEDVLGIGGMAVVYRAMQLSLGRRVALKVLNPRLAADATFRERFRREGALVAALDHVNVIPVYDFGEADGRLYLAMRLVDGVTLSDRMLDAPLSPTETLSMAAAVASALDAAHGAGLLHRDVKPQNILLSHSGAVYLADFGVAKMAGSDLTHTGGFLGSVTYVSPEHIRGDEIGPPTDVYALATVAFECLSGRAPFRRDTEAGVIHAHLSDPPPPLGTPGDPLSDALSEALATALAKDPAERPQSAGAFVTALAAALQGAPAALLDRRPGFPPGAPIPTPEPAADQPPVPSLPPVPEAEPVADPPPAPGSDAEPDLPPAPGPDLPPPPEPDLPPVADPLRDRGEHTIHDRRRDEFIRPAGERNVADLVFKALPVVALLAAIAIPFGVWSAMKEEPVTRTEVGVASAIPIAGWKSAAIDVSAETEAVGLDFERGRRWRSPDGKATVVVGELRTGSRLAPTGLGDGERVAQVKVPDGTLRRWSVGDPSVGAGPAGSTPPGATSPAASTPTSATTPTTPAATGLRSIAIGYAGSQPFVISCTGPLKTVQGPCSTLVASLDIDDGSLTADPDPAVATALGTAVSTAETARARTLLPSKDRTVRARRAASLAKAYGAAAQTLEPLRKARPWDGDLVAAQKALAGASTAYKRVGSAASAKDRTRDRQARAALRSADRALTTALGRLGRRGYAARSGT